jgi:ABC-type multidrug transport system ATPase subunit/membrane protease YdiL (CAAX protease family)
VKPALTSIVLLALLGPALLVLAPTAPPHAPIPPAMATPLGLAAGLLLFACLAHARPRPSLTPVALAAVAVGVSEEAAWRGFALARLAAPVGLAAAVGITSVCFAATHLPALRLRGAAVQLVTGGVFGTVFAATGSLLACALAHAAYNAFAVRPAAVLSFEGVEKRFGSTVALRGLDLSIGRGELVALLGPNGAGKTTLASLVLGLRRPTAGRVRVLGRDPRQWRSRIGIGATPQEMGFPPTLRAREILAFARMHAAAAPPVAELAGRFGLEEVMSRRAGALSGGQRRRLALALAFACAPELVVLDEPTTGLDVEARRSAWAAIAAFAAEGGTVLFATHHLEEAHALAGRVIVLAKGAVVRDGRVDSEDELLCLTK